MYLTVFLAGAKRRMLTFLSRLQTTNAEKLKQIFPEKELSGHSPNFHTPVFVIDLLILLQEICGPITDT
jgi:hypothetical protein